ncbi:glycine cleavage system protein GcvH [Amycolatopsis rhabdoformis]|uniref:Glycine cleavage system H protein n=1 Tax=Amycolatopsis rhabdoformis TaxID=1448059 RepID=A0ABZ1HVD9_9PSEU|nr:glycine cleavage system protein GcvH [Amycolatopsis rhabdoformis]WSE26250.1 glycine cleavage system protein GcvH [Amycolatopsis rhabdoformis]
MAEVDPEVEYTDTHQWVRRLPADSARIGISDFAQDELGDIISVTLPAVGATLAAGEPFGEIESTKSVAEVYAPVSGVVTAVNGLLADSPEIVNDDPYGEGWLVTVDVRAGETKLMAAQEYRTFSEG